MVIARAREQGAAQVFLLHRQRGCWTLMKGHVARTSPHAAAGRPVGSHEPTSPAEAGRRRATSGAPRAIKLGGGWCGHGCAETITGATASARRNGGGRSGGALRQRPYVAWDDERVRNRTTVVDASPAAAVVGGWAKTSISRGAFGHGNDARQRRFALRVPPARRHCRSPTQRTRGGQRLV